MILDPSGPDRALLADQVFARIEAGASHSEAAAALGLSKGQVRRMVRAYARVGRDRLVSVEIDESVKAGPSSQTPPSTSPGWTPPAIVRSSLPGPTRAAVARRHSAAIVAATFPSEATDALAANALALYEREAAETAEQRAARLGAEDRAAAEDRRHWGGIPDGDSFGV